MFKYNLLFMLALFVTGSALAQEGSTHTLFAVDLSLSAADRDAAFDAIGETTLNAPESQAVGLTLFDDTVRAYLAPAILDAQQIKALNQAIADAPNSVRSTSNMTVGIERAIDAFSPTGGAELVVFSRGVIDTATDDPRARFTEWLEKILLPQATSNNISVVLVVPQSEAPDPLITQAFGLASAHQIFHSQSGNLITPELISLLNIPSRTYGTMAPTIEPVATLPTPAGNETASQIAVAEQADTSVVGVLPDENMLPMARMVLLAIALALLAGIVIWRYRSRRAPVKDHHSAVSKSTYLPLSEKPSKTMEHWKEKGTGLPQGRSSNSGKPGPDSQAQGYHSSDTTIKANTDDTDPWDKF